MSHSVYICIRRSRGHEPVQQRAWRALCAAPGAAASTAEIGVVVRRSGETWHGLRSSIARYLGGLAEHGYAQAPPWPGQKWRARRRTGAAVPMLAPGGGEVLLITPPVVVEQGELWRGLLSTALRLHGPRELERLLAAAAPAGRKPPSEAALRDWAAGRRKPRPPQIRLLLGSILASGEIAPAARKAAAPPTDTTNQKRAKARRVAGRSAPLPAAEEARDERRI